MYAIYSNMCHLYTPNVSINLPLTWILWVMVDLDAFHADHGPLRGLQTLRGPSPCRVALRFRPRARREAGAALVWRAQTQQAEPWSLVELDKIDWRNVDKS